MMKRVSIWIFIALAVFWVASLAMAVPGGSLFSTATFDGMESSAADPVAWLAVWLAVRNQDRLLFVTLSLFGVAVAFLALRINLAAQTGAMLFGSPLGSIAGTMMVGYGVHAVCADRRRRNALKVAGMTTPKESTRSQTEDS